MEAVKKACAIIYKRLDPSFITLDYYKDYKFYIAFRVVVGHKYDTDKTIYFDASSGTYVNADDFNIDEYYISDVSGILDESKEGLYTAVDAKYEADKISSSLINDDDYGVIINEKEKEKDFCSRYELVNKYGIPEKKLETAEKHSGLFRGSTLEGEKEKYSNNKNLEYLKKHIVFGKTFQGLYAELTKQYPNIKADEVVEKYIGEYGAEKATEFALVALSEKSKEYTVDGETGLNYVEPQGEYNLGSVIIEGNLLSNLSAGKKLEVKITQKDDETTKWFFNLYNNILL